MSSAQATRVCPNPRCGRTEPADVDFCLCGTYLAWDDAEADEAALTGPPAPATQQLDLGAERPVVALSVAVPGSGPTDRPLELNLAPGTALTLTATIRNIGPVVDAISLSVDGVPREWVTIAEPVAHLLPVGPQGDYERKIKVVIRPPRSSDAVARTYPATIRATSAASPDHSAQSQIYINLLAYYALLMAARPAVLVAGRRGTMRCEIRNNGNTPMVPQLEVTDATGACRTAIPAIDPPIAPGRIREVPVLISARRPLFGHPGDRHLTAVASVEGLAEPTPAQVVIFRQRPWIPWWVPVVVAMLAALALAIIALVITRPHKVTTPAVIGSPSAFQAQRALQTSGFTAPPVVDTRIHSQIASGTVIGQTPGPGIKVAANTVVTLLVAVPPATTIVPDLRHETVPVAEGRLYQAHLTLGPVLPALSMTRQIVSQLPAPGSVRPRETEVTLFVAVPPATTIVPDLRHETVPVAEGRLFQAHLTLGPVLPALSMTRQIVSQLPVPGSVRPRGTQVTLILAGTANVVVPNLQCLTLQAADARLYSLGLKLLLPSTTTNANSLVQSQIPGPGQKRPPGTTVIVSVNGTTKACQQPAHPPTTTPSSGLDPPPTGRDSSPDKTTAAPSKAPRARTSAAPPVRPARTTHSTARASSSGHPRTRRERPHG